MRRVAIAIAILAVAVGGLIYLRRQQASDERAARRDAVLLAFDEREVDVVELTLDGVLHRFERRADGWWVAAPFRDRAEGEAIADLLSLSQRSPVLLTIDEPEALSAYGLSPPRFVLRVDGAGEVPALRIGSVAPDGSGVYGVVEGRPGVLLVEAPPGGALTSAQAEDFRERSVSGLPRTAIEGVDLSGGRHPPLGLRRDEQGWWVESPIRVPASDAVVNRLLDAIDTAEVVRRIDGADRDDPAFGLAGEATTVVLRSADASRTVRVGSPTGTGMTYVARDDRPPVLVVRGEAIGAIPRTIADLGDARLTKINRYRVRALSYVRGAERFEADRDPDSGAWSASGNPLDENVVYAFLVKTLEAPIRAWTIDPPPRGEPEAELSWTLADGAQGRARFWPGGVATVDGLDGLTATLERAPPPAP